MREVVHTATQELPGAGAPAGAGRDWGRRRQVRQGESEGWSFSLGGSERSSERNSFGSRSNDDPEWAMADVPVKNGGGIAGAIASRAARWLADWGGPVMVAHLGR